MSWYALTHAVAYSDCLWFVVTRDIKVVAALSSHAEIDSTLLCHLNPFEKNVALILNPSIGFQSRLMG